MRNDALDWTLLDQAQAMARGWCLVRCEHHGLRIARAAVGPDLFDSDEAADNHVLNFAGASSLCRKALDLVDAAHANHKELELA